MSTSATIADQLFINNEWQAAASGETLDVVNPATEEIVAKVPAAGDADVDAAVSAARAALHGPWAKLSARERGRLLWRLGERLFERADHVARLETLHNGKPIFESRQIEIPASAECFEYYAGWADKIQGETIPVKGHHLTYTLRDPVGVVAAIVPWNFPLLLTAWKVAPALACGNTVIIKPASQTPLTALALAEIALEIGLPPGVLNVVTGPARAWDSASSSIPASTRSRSPGTRRQAARSCVAPPRPSSASRSSSAASRPTSSFQTRTSTRRCAARRSGFSTGKAKSARRVHGCSCIAPSRTSSWRKSWRARRRWFPATRSIPRRASARLPRSRSSSACSAISRPARRKGACLVAGGSRADIGTGKGYFLQPTIFADVTPTMTIAREEIFGPVLAVVDFDEVDEAIERANESSYGLAAGVWTRDIKKAHDVARRLQAGTVWINTYNVYDAAAPFGGYKQSGFGRELGAHALEHYTQVKTVWVDLNQ